MHINRSKVLGEREDYERSELVPEGSNMDAKDNWQLWCRKDGDLEGAISEQWVTSREGRQIGQELYGRALMKCACWSRQPGGGRPFGGETLLLDLPVWKVAWNRQHRKQRPDVLWRIMNPQLGKQTTHVLPRNISFESPQRDLSPEGVAAYSIAAGRSHIQSIADKYLCFHFTQMFIVNFLDELSSINLALAVTPRNSEHF